MNSITVLLIFLGYLCVMFGVAYLMERRKSKVRNPYSYPLALTVYCTAWTFLGSVGKAANDGLSFLPIYLGPLMLAPLWPILIKKIIRISKAERLTSLPDFLSNRYGKSRSLGVMAAMFLVVAVIPYISIQLKGIAVIFDQLTINEYSIEAIPFYRDNALILTFILAIFISVFGVRRLDPSKRHEGIMAAISFDAVFKLLAFLSVGVITFLAVFGSNWRLAFSTPELSQIVSFSATGITGWDWFWLNLVSMCAIVLLPRQFHVAVVENKNEAEVDRAAWFFPLYLLVINIFVIPIAAAGLIYFGKDGLAFADTFMIALPLALELKGVAIIAALGGFAAATGMVIMSTIALSLMIGNNIMLPFLLSFDRPGTEHRDLSQPLLKIRRLIIFLVLILAYGYYKGVAAQYSLVAIGLISFTAVAQFAPAMLAALYWKDAARLGVKTGLIAGFCVWSYTLAMPTLLESMDGKALLLTEGPFGISFLRPQALLGSGNMNPVAHGAFWSILANVGGLVIGSLFAKPDALEISQADYFVNHHKYAENDNGFRTRLRQARVSDLKNILGRFTGLDKADKLIENFYLASEEKANQGDFADPRLYDLVEQELAGTIGSASAQVILKGISYEEPIRLEEVIRILQRTQDAVRYGRELEQKQNQLEELTIRLRGANQRLQELDRMKADFISTVTHELRTPITSVKSLARILLDTPDIDGEQRMTFLKIIVSESERLARLVSQVLDIQKLESGASNQKSQIDLDVLIRSSIAGISVLADQRGVKIDYQARAQNLFILGPPDRLQQVMINLLGNALKFAPQQRGYISVTTSVISNEEDQKDLILIKVSDNGPGIRAEQRDLIFDRFTQISDEINGKPAGSGLGLFISRKIVERCGGGLNLDPEYSKGASFIVRLPRYHIEDVRTETAFLASSETSVNLKEN